MEEDKRVTLVEETERSWSIALQPGPGGGFGHHTVLVLGPGVSNRKLARWSRASSGSWTATFSVADVVRAYVPR
jgi:hypothetical protein